MQRLFLGFTFLLVAITTEAVEIHTVNKDKQPLATVMITVKPVEAFSIDKSDNGYPAHGGLNQNLSEITRFSDNNGILQWGAMPYQQAVRYRFRKMGYKDKILTIDNSLSTSTEKPVIVTLEQELDPHRLAEQKPGNAWFAALDLGGDKDLKKHFVLQCGFCHQQGSKYLRWHRSADEWSETFDRMIGYGSRLHNGAQNVLPELLENGYKALRDHPESIPAIRPWDAALKTAQIEEWALGDSFSQMHDLFLAKNGLVYVGDNLQDRLYEVDPKSGNYTVYRIPHDKDDELGGLFSARLKQFPKHETYMGIHSFAESPVDGHLFITASVQQAILEFDPETKAFTKHPMEKGYYPHTVRVDQNDRIWFTLAISNQIAMFDRQKKKFHYYDLPNRSLKESITVAGAGVVLKLLSWGFPLHLLPIDKDSMGVPLPYGIDITPDGTVWFARLHTDAIGKIDPKTHQVSLIDTPFKGPRRLRTDSKGNLWIAAFPEGQIVKFNPSTNEFTRYDLPTEPLGSETPYSLNVDLKRDIVWVNGTASDSLISFTIETETWAVYPMSRRVTFTRDVEIAEDGSVYTANSSFPSWHIEDSQPTLIHLTPSLTPSLKSAE